MKFFIIALACVASAFAVQDSFLQLDKPHPDAKDIVIEIIDEWTLPEKALDLTVMQTASGPVVLGIDNGDDVIRIWEDGQTSQTITLPPASTGHAWGLGCSNTGDTVSEIIVNDFDAYSFYQSDDAGITWGTQDDPGGKYSRGLSFDGTHYWTVINGTTDELCRFQPGGSSQSWSIPEIGAMQQGSGVATFPLEEGNTGIAVGVFDIGMFFFYSWDGSDISYIGSVESPYSTSVLVSLGLAYCDTSGHFFWTYGPEAGYRMVEFTVSLSSQSLASTSWGAIKNSF